MEGVDGELLSEMGRRSIEGGAAILRGICSGPGRHLLPPPEARILLDRDYLFSALGTLAQAYPEDVKATFREWVESSSLQPQE